MECKLSNTLSVMHYVCIGRYFRTEDSKENVIVKQVGNVTADSEITYEYGVRKVANKPSKKLSAQPKIKEEKEGEDDEGDIVKSKGLPTNKQT